MGANVLLLVERHRSSIFRICQSATVASFIVLWNIKYTEPFNNVLFVRRKKNHYAVIVDTEANWI